MSNSWNGEHDVESVYAIYASAQAAENFVNSVMVGRDSPYQTKYYVEPVDMVID